MTPICPPPIPQRPSLERVLHPRKNVTQEQERQRGQLVFDSAFIIPPSHVTSPLIPPSRPLLLQYVHLKHPLDIFANPNPRNIILSLPSLQSSRRSPLP